MGHLLVAEKIERTILFNLRASANPLFCSRVTRIIKETRNIFFQDIPFTFIAKIYFTMLRARIVIKLVTFSVHVFDYVYRLMTLTSFYIYLYHFLTILLIIYKWKLLWNSILHYTLRKPYCFIFPLAVSSTRNLRPLRIDYHRALRMLVK